MEKLKNDISTLPVFSIDGETFLSYQAVTNKVAAFLFPTTSTEQIAEAKYQRILETADSLCHELGYRAVVKLTPPDVSFADMGLYWSTKITPAANLSPEPTPTVIHAGPGRFEMMQDGHLLDAHLSQLGLDEVTRQHFKIPVTASAGVIDLMHKAVNSNWPNDYKGIWHDILGMCVVSGRDVNVTERVFTVIIRGLGRRLYWHFKAKARQDGSGSPFLCICLADEAAAAEKQLFSLGHVVMTPGAADLGVDFTPYLDRHAQGDWGDALDTFDRRQNDLAVKNGYRILSAYDVQTGKDETLRIWIITEADRSATTLLLPSEY